MAQLFQFPFVYASTKTWAQTQAAGFNGLLEEIVANQAATADPTAAPTATATGGGATGGLLAAGTYYLVFTETNGLGETLKSPESAQLTVGATNIPRVTFPTLKTNNVARHLYTGAVNGPSGGPYKRYASYITTTTHDMTTAVLATSDATAPPTVNGTAPDRKAKELLHAIVTGRHKLVFDYANAAMNSFASGDPVSWREGMLALQRVQWVFRCCERAVAFYGEKARANPGTLGGAVDPIGHTITRRTWP